MKRRDFIRRSVAGAVGAGALAGCAQQSSGPAVQTRPRVAWRLASSYPPGLDTIYGAGEFLARRVGEITDGRFTMTAYPAGELVPGLQVMDAVQQGTVQMGHSASYYFIGKNPALAFDTCLAFGLTARQQLAWLHEGGGLELMRDVFADFNIINFPGGTTGAQMGGWFRREINSVDDLKGLKMRIPGAGGEVMSRLGVTVQVLAGGEIYPALERGAIDATEWVGPYDDEKLGFHKVAKNYYYPGWWEPGPTLAFYVNKTAWDKLPSSYQAALETAAAEASQTMLVRYDAQNPAALDRIRAEGVNLHRFSDDLMKAASRAHDEIVQDHVSKDADYARIYKAWKKFRDDSFRWFATAESAYANFAFPGV